MNSILAIPEIQALEDSTRLLRIPNQIDTPVFQRLKSISQLGLVSFVYPAANHTRFEHSLGVYRNCLMFVRHLAWQERFRELVSETEVEALLLAALFHDIGHWPFCHPIEDMALPGIPSHESLAAVWLNDNEVQSSVSKNWNAPLDLVSRLINKETRSKSERLLASILSGPIDIDKMDYLYRDSLHAGVPYGQNFDSARLIRSLCLNESGDKLAIESKGRTAAELMVFARYVMFSEVYWHHAVRSATAMLQRAFFRTATDSELSPNRPVNWDSEFKFGEAEFIRRWRERVADNKTVSEILNSLFGVRRSLYKRAANFSFVENEGLYRKLAHRSYKDTVQMGGQLAEGISDLIGTSVNADEILIDAPPVKLEVQFDIDVHDVKSNSWKTLGEASPVIHTLAKKQFDDYVKRVRVFVAPRLTNRFSSSDLIAILEKLESVD
jgi:HD superfamily phosphohydrolase